MKRKLDMIEMQAFPCFHGENYKPQIRLTKREYFAAMAMQGMLSQNIPGLRHIDSLIAHYAVEFADALIERLNMDAEVKLPEDPWRLNEKK